MFSDRQGSRIRALGGESEDAISECFSQLGRSVGADESDSYRRAVVVSRTLQTASSACWGGNSSGLCALLQEGEGVTLNQVC